MAGVTLVGFGAGRQSALGLLARHQPPLGPTGGLVNKAGVQRLIPPPPPPPPAFMIMTSEHPSQRDADAQADAQKEGEIEEARKKKGGRTKKRKR